MILLGILRKAEAYQFTAVDCVNVHTEEAIERLLEVEWEGSPEKEIEYNVDIEISGYDRRGLLNEVLQAVTETKTYISAVSGRSDRNKMATINMSISIRNLQHLKK